MLGIILFIIGCILMFPFFKLMEKIYIKRDARKNPALLYRYQCHYCGFIFNGALKYCPNCHREMSYSETNQVIDNYKDSPNRMKNWDDLEEALDSADPIGCALASFFIIFVILVIMAYIL